MLAAVIAEPDDLDVRRVYGDWLSEQGDVRGELVLLECAGKPTDTLLRKHRAWIASQVPYLDSFTVRRGLIEEAAIYANKFRTYGKRLFAEHPIQKLTLYVNDVAPIAKLPISVKELVVEGRMSPKPQGETIGLAALAKAPWFAKTRHLTLSSVMDKESAWKAFFSRAELPVLETLELAYANAGFASLPRVHELVLMCPDFSHQGERPETAYRV